MKKRQLKIRGILLISLVIILGSLLILYFAFCRDGDYNTAPIETSTQVESTTEAPTEIVEEETTEPEEVIEEETTKEPIIWDNYSPASVLASENWALTLINKNYPLDKNYSPTTAPVIEGSSVKADIRVAEAYRLMYNAALTEDIVLTPYSGYSGYQRQKTIYDNKVQAFVLQGLTEDEAKQSAEKRVEPAGCSENGAGLAVVMPAWMEFVMNHNVMRFAQMAVRIWGCEMNFENPEETAKAGIKEFRKFLRSIGMPINFAELGAKAEDIPVLVEKHGLGDGKTGGFVQLSAADVAEILNIAVNAEV